MSRVLGIVKVTRFIPDTDMRAQRKLSERGLHAALRPGSAWLFMNKRRTIARLVDKSGALHTYYAPKGEVFDADLLNEQANAASLVLSFPRAVVVRVRGAA